MKLFRRWMTQRFVAPEPEEAGGGGVGASPGALGTVWERLVELDAKLVAYLARDPPPAEAATVKRD